MRILVAYDGSPASDAALDEVIKRPWPAGSSVHIVSVVEWPIAFEPPFPADYPGPAMDRVHEGQIEEGKRRVAAAKRRLSERSDLTVTTDLREGSPKHALLDAIEEWKPDLTLAGSTGKTRLKRMLLGSVCHALVSHAPCNIEVVKLQPGK